MASAVGHAHGSSGYEEVLASRRLRIEELVPAERALVGSALFLTALCGVLVVWESVPLSLPGGRAVAPVGGQDLRAELIPTLVMSAGCLAMAAASAIFAYGTTRPGWPLPVVTRVLLALPAAAIASTAYTAEHGIPSVFRQGGGFPAVVRYGSLCLVIVQLVLPFVPRRLWRRFPFVFAGVVAAAWASVPLLYLFDLTKIEDFALTSRTIATWGFFNVALIAVFGLQAVEGVRASVRDVAEPIATVGSRLGWLVPAAVVVALMFVVGIAGGLPGGLGTSGAWQRAGDDDIVAWVLAVVMAAAILALAVRPTTASARGTADGALAVVVTGWMSVFVVTAVVSMLGPTWQVVDADGTWPEDTAATILRAAQEVDAAVILAALAIGLVLLWRRGLHSAAAIFLTLFGIWNLPAAYALLTRGHAVGGPGAPELVTLTLAVAVGVAVAALWARRRGRRLPGRVAIAFVAFTVVAVAEPAHDLLRQDVSDTIFYAALVLPIIYLFLADAEHQQPQDGRAPTALLVLVGLTTLALSIALLRVSLGTLTPAAGSETGFLRYALVVPLAATIVALASRRRPVDAS